MYMKDTMRKLYRNGFVGRVSILLLIMTLLVGVLAGCAGGGATTPTLSHNPSFDAAKQLTEENGMNADQVNLIISNIEKNENAVTIRQMLVAALNGYDMTVTDFNDDALPEAHPENAPAYLFNILKKYEITTTATEETTTVADVQLLVDAFKTEVVVEENMNFFTRLLHWIALGFEWIINVPGFGSFILGTFIFAILIEILMLPLGIHQQRNSRKQARLRPKEMAIRNKYKGRTDQATQQKIQQEIQELYNKEGINPLASGCLPLLISMPIIFALYYIVIDPLKYMMASPSGLTDALISFATAPKAAGGLGLTLQSSRGTIEILSHLREMGGLCPDTMGSFAYFSNSADVLGALNNILSAHAIPDFSIGSVNFGLTPSITNPSWLWLVPVLTFGIYFGSMKLNRLFTYQPTTANDPGMGCSNKIMDLSMPLISAWFTFMVPGAVGVYWAFKSIVSTIKQFILNKIMPMPQFTEADYKAAERELAGKEKNKPVKKSGTRNPNVRSLHHIDDEDYDTTPVQPKRRGAYVEEDEPADAPADTAADTKAGTQAGGADAAKGNTFTEGATLKEDKTAAERRNEKNNKE